MHKRGVLVIELVYSAKAQSTHIDCAVALLGFRVEIACSNFGASPFYLYEDSLLVPVFIEFIHFNVITNSSSFACSYFLLIISCSLIISRICLFISTILYLIVTVNSDT